MRELRNVVERAVYRHEDPERPVEKIQFDPFESPWVPAKTAAAPAQLSVTEDDLVPREPLDQASPALPVTTGDFRGAVANYERALLEDALSRNRFNQRATANALGLSYDQLRHALKRHKLHDTAG